MAQADIAVIGMAVMGRNLAMNIAEKGFKVAVYNRSSARTDEALAEAGDLAGNMIACRSIEELVAALKPPRALLLMVKAGAAVDETIAQLKPHLAQGDIIIDAGNANYRDSVAHDQALSAEGFEFLGVGVSGGEEGARHGPSIMVGGSQRAWERVQPVLTAIAARYQGESCCAYMGPAGAGHFVKTLHNGIEYADMQMIAEAYGLMRAGLGMTPSAIADVFEGWTKGPLASYLTEITVQALRAADPTTGKPLVDIILDSAGQKGTGRWSAIEALDLGVPASAIAAAVEARGLSGMRSLRQAVNSVLGDAERAAIGTATPEIIAEIEKTLLTGKILAYAQGFDVLAAGSKQFGWNLPLAEIAKIWRAGCIIRSRMLDSMSKAYSATPAPESLILDPDFAGELKASLPAARKILGLALANGHPVPALTSALNYLQQLRASRATVDLVQAQRDIFGAHGFERIDQPGAHHGPWHTGAE